MSERFEKIGVLVGVHGGTALHHVWECQMCFTLVVDARLEHHTRWHALHPSTDGYRP